MKVNVSKKTMMAVTLCVLAIILIIVGKIAVCMYTTRGYVKTEGTVVSVDKSLKHSASSTKKSMIYNISYTYVVDGKEYNNSFKTIVKFGLKPGKSFGVYYNKDNPSEVRGSFRTDCLLLMCTMVLESVCVAMTLKAEKS